MSVQSAAGELSLRALRALRARISGIKWRLKHKAYAPFFDRRFPSYIYDAFYFVRNREPIKLYTRAKAILKPIEQKIVDDLRKDGISLVHLNDLLEEPTFEDVQGWAEQLLAVPSIQERINIIATGARLEAKGGKYFLVRPLGEQPVININDAGMKMSVSTPVLRVIAEYLGSFGRLVALGLWYNVPTQGPAILSQRWHRDPEDKRMVKTFLYLRDVDETTGPFCFVRGSHNSGPYKHVRPRNSHRYPEDGFVENNLPAHLIQTCTGRKGTLIFCDTSGFHKGGQPTKQSRFLFNGVYTTNGGIPMVLRRREYQVVGDPADALTGPAAYAIGHVSEKQSA